MKLILKENIPSLGTMGSVAEVKAGYARNYLLPRGLAVVANEANESELKHHLAMLERRKAKELEKVRALATEIERTSVTVTKQVGEDERIFGTVTTTELEALLLEEGIKVSRKNIKLEEDIKKVGVFTASVHLHPEVDAAFKVWVVAE